MKKTKKIFVVTWLFCLIVQLLPFPVFAWTSPGGESPAPLRDIEVVFAYILRIVTTLAGLAVLAMLIVGGFQYLTAGDNPKNAEKASKTLTYAIGGLALIIAAWFILQAIQRITGLNVTIFRLF